MATEFPIFNISLKSSYPSFNQMVRFQTYLTTAVAWRSTLSVLSTCVKGWQLSLRHQARLSWASDGARWYQIIVASNTRLYVNKSQHMYATERRQLMSYHSLLQCLLGHLEIKCIHAISIVIYNSYNHIANRGGRLTFWCSLSVFLL